MQKTVLQSLLAFFLTVLFLWGLLTLAAAIPNEAISDTMLQSAMWYSDTEPFQLKDGKRLFAVSDNYADCILLGVSHYMGESDAFLSALDTKYYRGEKDGLGVNTAFFLALTDDAPADTDYSRYWHGMAAFVRIVHLFGTVKTIKWIGFTAFILFALLTVGILIKQKNYKTAIALVAAILCMQPWNIRLSMEYQSPFVICFLLCPMYLYFERRNEKMLPILSVIGGVMTAFFDFLTCETVAILLPLLLITSVRLEEGRNGTGKATFRMLFGLGFAFFASYAGTYLVKWGLASLVTGENKFALALSSAELHSIGDAATNLAPHNTFLRILLSPIANLTVLFGGTARIEGMRVVLGLLLSAAILGSVLYLFKKKTICRGIGFLPLLGSVVFLRYAVLNYHSYVHAFFTYRALIAPVFAVFVILLFCIERPQTRKEVRKH